MAETVLKFPPEDKKEATTGQPTSVVGKLKSRRRTILLVVIPILAVVAGFWFYLSGGRYISTDNAYVGSPKVLITPDISGKVAHTAVAEGQRVKSGDELLTIDKTPFEFALAQAQAKVATVRTDFANLKSNLATLGRQIDLAKEAVSVRQADVDRKKALLANHSAASQADVDTSTWNLMGAKTQLETLLQQQATIHNQLLGNPDLPIEQFPAYQQAAAALDQTKRDLDHTVLRAPIDGIATQVDNVQLGRFVTAGTPIFSIIDDRSPWVDANPKETEITYLKIGQPVSISVDSFPNREFHGVVASVSPGTGAQFAILPPQNASGNWIKVVQRVPVRITFAPGDDINLLRAGMSANVEIDTGRKRTLLSVLGFAATAKDPQK